MNITNVLDVIEVERGRRMLGLCEPDPHASAIWRRALNVLSSDVERDAATAAFHFAKKISYVHEGLTSEIYFSHPLRVAGIGLLLDRERNIETAIVGLIHNVLEVSELSDEIVLKNFGNSIYDQITALTVDRKLQWNIDYKKEYYKKLMDCARPTQIVKIIDKLDNLFLLNLNSDLDVKEKYLAEIDMFVLPMVKNTLPQLVDYFSGLVRNCHIEVESSNLTVNNIKGSNET